MRIAINQLPYEVENSSKVSDALRLINAKPPYAVAVNLQFVPKSRYTEHGLHENDHIEVIAPVTGG